MRQKELFAKPGLRRVKFSLSPSTWDAAGDIASRVGCSRSAVASALLESTLDALCSLPKRVVNREVSLCRRSVIGDIDRWKQKVILRARGPSLAYISVVLDGLLAIAAANDASEIVAALGAGKRHAARK